MGRYRYNMTAVEWRLAFVEEHEGDTERMQASCKAQGLDIAAIRWDGNARLVAVEVFDYVRRYYGVGRGALSIMAALVGGLAPSTIPGNESLHG